jgi:ubiquinol-cytochrome c reductase cytochrome b subunit
VFLVPALIFIFVAVHLRLVLRHGIAEPPTAGKPVHPKTYRREYEKLLDETGHPFWPDGAWRDFVFGTGLIVAIALLALFVGPPPLDKPPDPSILQADPRPDWYLLWYFAVLALIPPRIEGYVMILAPAMIGVLLLVLPLLSNRGERAPSRRPWSIAIVLLSIILIGSLWIEGSKSPWSPNFAPVPLTAKIIGATDGPVFQGAHLFQEKACLNCHLIEGHGGRRGPELTYVADKLTKGDMIIRIANGGVNMPAFGATLKPEEINALIAFLESRRKH